MALPVVPIADTAQIAAPAKPGAITGSPDAVCLVASSAPAPSTAQNDPTRDALVTDAEAAIRDGDTPRALVLLERLLTTHVNPQTPRACELLGLLRERAGRREDARALYQAYLTRFAGDEGVPRVRQRLAALDDTASPQVAVAPGLAAPSARRTGAPSLHGTIMQSYLHDRSRSVFLSVTPVTPSTAPDRRDNVDEVLSVADVVGSVSTGSTRIEARASVGRVAEYRPVNLVGANRNRGSYDLLDRLYVDIANDRLGASLRFGRQVEYGYGIFGRFDGIRASFDVRRGLRINALAGYPVWSERQTSVDRSRSFYGVSADLASADGRRSASLYWLDQRSAGLVDRRAIGVQARFARNGFSLYGLLDYDVAFGTLDAAFLTATFRIDRASNLAVELQQLHAPTLALTSAALGQPIPSLDVVRDLIGLDALRQAARDRTLRSRSATLTYTRAFGPRWQMIIDGGLFDTSASPASFGVPGFPASGTEVVLGAQLIGTSIALPRDAWLLGLRAAALQRSHLYASDFTVRLPVTQRLTLAPRLRAAFRDQRSDTGNQRVLAPSLRIVWSLSPKAQIELEGGGNFIWQHYSGPLTGSRFERAFIGHVGYRIRF